MTGKFAGNSRQKKNNVEGKGSATGFLGDQLNQKRQGKLEEKGNEPIRKSVGSWGDQRTGTETGGKTRPKRNRAFATLTRQGGRYLQPGGLQERTFV